MSKKKVAIEACFTDQVKDDCGLTPMFAMIALVAPKGYEGPVYCETTDEYVSTELPIKVNLDANGCLKSCPLIPNSSLNVKDCDGNPATYYEIVVVVADPDTKTNKCCNLPDNGSVAARCRQRDCNACNPATGRVAGKVAFSTKFVLDDSKNNLPACVKLNDVTIDHISCEPSALQCQLFQACETPWSGIAEGCIEITHGDHPSGPAGNGHAPQFKLKISDVVGNALACTDKGLYVALSDWDCNELASCSIGQMGDVDIEGCKVGGVLQWNGAGFVCGPKAQVDVMDGSCTIGTIVGTGSVQNPWLVSFDVEVSKDLDNHLECRDDGLYAKPSKIIVRGQKPDECDDPVCVDVKVTGIGTTADPVIISAAPVISPDANNTLECRPSGLYAGIPPVHAINCFSVDCHNPSDRTDIDLIISGTGVKDDPLVFCPKIILDPSDDNFITTGPNGLKVSCQEISDRIGLNSGRGLAYSATKKSLSLCLSSDDGNIASFGDDGCLFVPHPDLIGSGLKFVGCSNNGVDTTVTGLGTAPDPFRVCTSIKIDPNDKNLLSIEKDGLFAHAPIFRQGDHCDDTCISIDVTGCGAEKDPFRVKGVINISEWPNNAVICREDGLFVPVSDGSETHLKAKGEDCVLTTLKGTGTQTNPYDLIVGLNIDPSLTNRLRCGAQGLYVGDPDGSETKIQVKNGSCTDANIYGSGTTAAPYVIDFDVVVSGDPTNVIRCTDTGLYAPSPSLIIDDSNAQTGCLDLDLTGQGSHASPWELSGRVLVSTASTNLLTCNNGLYVGAPKIVTHATNCLELSVTGAGTTGDPLVINGGIKIDPKCPLITCGKDGLTVTDADLAAAINKGILNGKIYYPVSDDAGNCLAVKEDGLYVQCSDGSQTVVQHVSGKCLAASIVGSGTAKNPYVLKTDLQISDDADNTLLCTANGLYAPATAFDVSCSGCIHTSLKGLGTQASPYLVHSELQIDDDDCNAVYCTQTGLYVENRGYVEVSSACAKQPAIHTAISGSGGCGDPYELLVGLNVSHAKGNAVEVKEDGIYVGASGVIDQSPSSANAKLAAVETDCIKIRTTGTGSPADPYFLSADLIIDDQAVSNLVRCTSNGLLVDPAEVVKFIGDHYTGGGLEVNPKNKLEVKISADAKNCLELGKDQGLFVACPDPKDFIKLLAADSSCVNTDITGHGTDTDPYVVYSELKLDPDSCNALSCGKKGLLVKTQIGFEIGQDGVLDSTAQFPTLWRAWCDGTVEFKIAGLAYGSVSNGATHYEIISQSGDIVHSGFIPPGATYDTLKVKKLEVCAGQGYAVRVVAPFPAESNCDPACGLSVQGVYTPCCE